MNDRKPWPIQERDLAWSTSQSVRRGRSKVTRASRAADTRTMAITVRHMPTDIELSAEIPDGRYSRTIRQQMMETLRQEIEDAVAKQLRIPRR